MICVCKHCMKQYIKTGLYTATCDNCKDIDNMIFAQICAYLKNYPNSNALQVGEALGIRPMVVVKYIDEGRLCTNNGTFSMLPD